MLLSIENKIFEFIVNFKISLNLKIILSKIRVN